ncbi:MAG: hypothetical protein H0W12_02100 [Chitinophagaceae bacterium]|nr:hypothetical protein [Chitinophagaceae bacterium]
MKKNRSPYFPLIISFILLNGILFSLKNVFEKNGIDIDFIMVANLILFIITLAGFALQQKGLRSPNPNAFVRSVYASMIIKIFICLIAVTVYAFLNKEKINKASLFISMGLYIVYTVIEVGTLITGVSKSKNA